MYGRYFIAIEIRFTLHDKFTYIPVHWKRIIMSMKRPCVWMQGPLIDLKPRLTSYVKPGCLLLLSGIMTTQVPSIKEVYQDEFESFRVYSDEVWSLILAVRKVGPSCSLAFDIDKLPSSFTWSFKLFVSFAHCSSLLLMKIVLFSERLLIVSTSWLSRMYLSLLPYLNLLDQLRTEFSFVSRD